MIVTEDKLVSRSLYTTMDSLTGSDDAQMKLMGAMKEHFAGAPGRTTGMVDWTFAGTAAKPSGKKFVTEHVEPFSPRRASGKRARARPRGQSRAGAWGARAQALGLPRRTVCMSVLRLTRCY